jgi:hypothetical protein
MRTKRLRITTTLLALATLGSILSGAMTTARAATPSCASTGCWTAPFSPGASAAHPRGAYADAPPQTVAQSEQYPAAASQVMLPDGRIVYWNGLQNIEGCGQFSVAANAGACLGNAKSEVLDLRANAPLAPSFMPVAVPAGNHDDLFCSDQRLLENGTVLDTGGTYWATEEPNAGGTGIPGAAGLAELYGSKNTRTFNPATGKWTTYRTTMHDGRWYPTLLTLPNGDEFVAGGVTKLLWNSSIMTQVENAAGNTQYEQATFPLPENVQTTETWSLAHGGWALNPAKDNVELPLYGRLHLLPDGEIFYSSNGQMWGPAGESINELNWNNMLLFDPSKIGTASDQGWRTAGMFPLGSPSGAAEAMLPIDAAHPNVVHVLVAGGALGVSPDTYLAQSISQMITLTKSASGWDTSSAMTGSLNNGRWFSSSVVLPNGQVVVFNGADKDEVILPGSERPVHQAELFDPATNKWTALSSSARDRTYHNTAILLPDGSILVGGHAPINQGYGGTGNSLPLDQLGFVHNLKDPSFERFYPPYLFADPNRPRPKLSASQAHATWGETLGAEIAPGSGPIDHFVLSRLPAQTHITDADARTVILHVASRHGSSVSLDVPNNKIVPPGFYYLFAISPKGVPSVATIVQIADPHYYTPASTATPVHLVSQNLRTSATGSISAVRAPVVRTQTAKKAARTAALGTEANLATDVTIPAGAPGAQPRSSQAWLIVVVAVMGAVLTRRIWSLARR